MISIIFEGLLFGFFLSIYLGPVFLLLVETSIKSGVKDAFLMNAGVITSDLLWVFLLYFGIESYLGSFLYSPSSKVLAGSIFIMFGFGGLLFTKKESKIRTVRRKRRMLFTKGFLLNLINPSVALFWLATIAYAIRFLKNDKNHLILFFVSIFCTVLVVDAFKFFMARKLKVFLNKQRQIRLSKITNLIMIIFGTYLILFKSISQI